MKAITISDYGAPEVLRYKEVDKPALTDTGVLVRVMAASINAGDIFTMRGSPWLVRTSVGFPRPKDYILGWDIAGIVEAVGAQVTRFKPGDEVYTACNGAFAEYVCVVEGKLAHKPANLSFVEAAAVPTAGLTALQGLRDAGKVRPGQKVLINGASGGVGTFAVQIGRALGAEVTGVCSTRNVAMVRDLGADRVIDYTQEDFTAGSKRYDLILDNAASQPFSAMRRILTPEGKILPNSGHGGMGYVLKAFVQAPFFRQQGAMFMANTNAADLDLLRAWIEAGKVKPVVERTFAMADAREAFAYMEKEHARGKIVLTIADAAKATAAASQVAMVR